MTTKQQGKKTTIEKANKKIKAQKIDVSERRNFLKTSFNAVSKNEILSRSIVSAFLLELNPTIEELSDIKTAVSEAVTNCVVHGYDNMIGLVNMDLELIGNEITIRISDNGVGIEDIKKAREPFFTTKPQGERSGMGFTVMESFMDSVDVYNNSNGQGVTVVLKKKIKTGGEEEQI